MPASTTFVLVHGAWHGGWCWSPVASILRGRGHTVVTPTQTGLGERSHLLSPAINLEVFIADIVNVLVWEELTDVVLVGHSFGGAAISGAADRAADRIRQLVYLDALILDNGQSGLSQLPADVREPRTRAAQRSSAGLTMPAPPPSAFGITDLVQTAWVGRRLTPHPFATYTSPLQLASPVAHGLPTSYIVCADPIYSPLAASRDWAKAHGWKMTDIASGHDAMVIAPVLLADLLDVGV